MATATHLLNTTPTRRNMLGRLAVAAPLAGVAGAALAAPRPDPHVAWDAEKAALYADVNDDPSDDDHPGESRLGTLYDLVCLTPAGTIPGVRAQVVALAELSGVYDFEHGTQWDCLHNILATLDRLAVDGRA